MEFEGLDPRDLALIKMAERCGDGARQKAYIQQLQTLLENERRTVTELLERLADSHHQAKAEIRRRMELVRAATRVTECPADKRDAAILDLARTLDEDIPF